MLLTRREMLLAMMPSFSINGKSKDGSEKFAIKTVVMLVIRASFHSLTNQMGPGSGLHDLSS